MKHNIYKHPKYDKEADELFMKKYIHRFNYPLYHWTKSSLTQKILQSQVFRMKNAYEFADHEEFVKGLQFIIDAIVENRIRNVKFQILLGIKSELERVLIHDRDIIPYVACFTANKFNSHLKVNYGENGKGGLFKISPTRLATKSNLTFTQVIYDHDIFKTRVDELLWVYADRLHDYLQYKNSEANEAFRNIVPLLMRDIFILAISFKDPSYKDEEEYRFINFCLKGTIEYRDRSYLIFPGRYYNLTKIN